MVRIYCSGRRGLGTGFLKNLSSRGMFLRILEPEAEGTRLHFEFRPDPKHAATVTGTAEVAFRRETYGGPGRPPGMGVRFLALTREGSEIVSRLTGDEVRVPVGRVREVTKESIREAGTATGEEIPPPAPHDETTGKPEKRGRMTGEGASEAPNVDREAPGEPHDSGTGGPTEWASDRFWSVLALVLSLVSIALGFAFWEGWEAAPEPDPASGIEVKRLSAKATEEDPGGSSPNLGDPETGRPMDVEKPAGREARPRQRARRVEEIRWETGPSSLVVVLRGDGVFEDGQATYSHIGGDAPRGVVRIRSVERVSAGLRLTPESPLATGIRTGFHADGRGEGELHVVIDLADPETRITGVVASGTDLLVYLGRS